MTKSTSINQKKIENYSINGSSLNYEVEDFPFQVNSFPKKYNVSCIKNIDQYISLLRTADFIIIDKKVKELYPIPSDLKSIIFTVEAKEENKNLDTVLELINKFIRENISKGVPNLFLPILLLNSSCISLVRFAEVNFVLKNPGLYPMNWVSGYSSERHLIDASKACLETE